MMELRNKSLDRYEAASPDNLVNVRVACSRLGVCRTTLWKMRRDGDLETVYIGSAVRFRSAEIDKLVQYGTNPTRSGKEARCVTNINAKPRRTT